MQDKALFKPVVNGANKNENPGFRFINPGQSMSNVNIKPPLERLFKNNLKKSAFFKIELPLVLI